MKTYEKFYNTKMEQTMQWPKKIDKRTNTHLQNTTQRFHILFENRYAYHVLTFWFSKTKTDFELYSQ